MLAEINKDGDLVIDPTDTTEAYAMKTFAEAYKNGKAAIRFAEYKSTTLRSQLPEKE